MSIELSVALHTEANHLNRGHSQRKLIVEGGEGVLKNGQNEQGKGGSSLSVQSVCEKKLPYFFSF